ncbi:MAG TPA: sodium-transporting two-sector ATPase [Candidatus Saccharimonadales bacterium]|nr:sodium-transporting two-sector ATPase [Candidatus Saccharimonadales bacterium]
MIDDPHSHFQKFVAAGRPVGEVIAVDRFLIEIRGLQPVNVRSMVLFEDGSKGFVSQIFEDKLLVLHMGNISLKVGMVAVVISDLITTKVGKDFIGRVISPTGEPLDGKGAVPADSDWPVFNGAPPIYAREMLEDQLETGVTSIDALFPIVRGQRLALLGDSKSGKSTMATQIAINQRSTDQLVVYVLIAKRRSEVDALLSRLTDNQALSKAIVVVSTIFDSLVLSYLAPYVGCALAEYFWQKLGQDVVILYDDLTAHAQAYREIALLSRVSPGRDSYPGDMFHAHSSLLERAGRLKANHHSLTSIPLVLADGGDITGFLPTNVMSITDGQWILDMDVFRSGVRPALNVGLSVTRVGGRGHNDRQKGQNDKLLKTIAGFREAEAFSRFGSELSAETQKTVAVGRRINELFTQIPGETYNVLTQQLMIDAVLESEAPDQLDIAKIKEAAKNAAGSIKNDEDYKTALTQIKSLQPAAAPQPEAVAEAAPAAEPAKEEAK